MEQGETCLGVSLFGNSGFRIGETDCKMITRDDFRKGIKGNFFTNIAHFIFPNISKFSKVLPDIDFFYQYW